MKRWALGLAIVAAVAGVGLYWLYTSLDFVVKSAIEHFGPEIVGAPVSVRQVHLSAADGLGTLRGIEIGNPPGYSSRHALRAATLAVSLDPASLAKDVVVIHDILVDAPEISYELKGGTNNLEAIRRHIEAHVKRSGGKDGGHGGAQPAPGRRYVIGRITLRGAKVTMTNPLLKGGGLTFTLADIDLRDIGARSGGVTAAEAGAIVTGAILTRIGQSVLTNIDALRRGGVEGALDALRGLVR